MRGNPKRKLPATGENIFPTGGPRSGWCFHQSKSIKFKTVGLDHILT